MLQCFPLDNTGYEADALGAWFATRTRGVLSGDDNFAVTASGTGMSVTLHPGYSWLLRNKRWGTAVWAEEPETFTLDPADGTLSRIDGCRPSSGQGQQRPADTPAQGGVFQCAHIHSARARHTC